MVIKLWQKLNLFFIDYQTNIEKNNQNKGKIYDVYSDLMVKNPKYELDIPIDIASFNEGIKKIIDFKYSNNKPKKETFIIIDKWNRYFII